MEGKKMYLLKRIRSMFVIAVLGVGGSLKASPITVENAVFYVLAEGGIAISAPGTVTGMACTTGPEGGCESSSASMMYSDGDGSGSVQGTTSGGTGVASASATATATYYLEVVGPTDIDVPLLITASGSTSANGPEALGRSLVLFAGGEFVACSGTGLDAAVCENGSGQPYPTSFSGTQSLTVESNTLADVGVSLSGDSELGSGSFSANVDPTVEIDPTFADASEFTLVFSPDVSAPEPGTAVFALAAFFGLASMLLKRGRTSGPR
jgi:hypothetical protein